MNKKVKKLYGTPKLRLYGDIREITLALGMGKTFDSGMADNKSAT